MAGNGATKQSSPSASLRAASLFKQLDRTAHFAHLAMTTGAAAAALQLNPV